MHSEFSVRLNIQSHNCPLCRAADVSRISQDRSRDYYFCRTCHLVFVPSLQFLSAEDEKARYDLHQNSPDDQRYRKFLSRLFIPMQERLAPGSSGLDFGSGPGPTLSVMFEENGHSMAIYDHFYAMEPSVLEKQYDFITATEVLEHLQNPRMELDRLWTLLKPGGILGVMTQLVLDYEAKRCKPREHPASPRHPGYGSWGQALQAHIRWFEGGMVGNYGRFTRI